MHAVALTCSSDRLYKFKALGCSSNLPYLHAVRFKSDCRSHIVSLFSGLHRMSMGVCVLACSCIGTSICRTFIPARNSQPFNHDLPGGALWGNVRLCWQPTRYLSIETSIRPESYLLNTLNRICMLKQNKNQKATMFFTKSEQTGFQKLEGAVAVNPPSVST